MLNTTRLLKVSSMSTPATSKAARDLPELSAAVTTAEIFAEIDLTGLDAVYLGHPYCLKIKGNLLNDLEGLSEVIKKINATGKRAYLTTPIVPRSTDFSNIKAVIERALWAGVKAVEVHDVGVFHMLKDSYPDLPIHMSSLANIYQPETAAYYRDQGVRRIVPANELLNTEMKIIKDAVAGVEFSVPVYGLLPLGMSYACMLRLKFPARELSACRQQCDEEHYMEVDDWRMRCVGMAMVTADDFSIIEQLPEAVGAGWDGFRLETHFDDSEKINAVVEVYSSALASIQAGHEYPRENLYNSLTRISGKLCNGWRFGLSGRDYYSAADEDPLAAAERRGEKKV